MKVAVSPRVEPFTIFGTDFARLTWEVGDYRNFWVEHNDSGTWTAFGTQPQVNWQGRPAEYTPKEWHFVDDTPMKQHPNRKYRVLAW